MVVGRYCSIAVGLRIIDDNHPAHLVSSSVFTYMKNPLISDGVRGRDLFPRASWRGGLKPEQYPRLGHDVWIGSCATLGPGITIGTGAVIAANAVVTKSVPPYAVVAGNPAVIKKYRFNEKCIEALLASQWWEYLYTDFAGLPLDDPLAFADLLAERVANGVTPHRPGRLIMPDVFESSPEAVAAARGTIAKD
jgi:hypothetical protein